jgi:hypothetical protein
VHLEFAQFLDNFGGHGLRIFIKGGDSDATVLSWCKGWAYLYKKIASKIVSKAFTDELKIVVCRHYCKYTRFVSWILTW